MTQALINNLNVIFEKENLTNKMSKTTGMDFGKIFETKNVIKNQNKPDADKAQVNEKSFDKNKADNTSTTIVNAEKDVQNTYKKDSDSSDKTQTTNTVNKDEKENNDGEIKKLTGIIKKNETENTKTEEITEPETEENTELIIAEDDSEYTDDTIITEEEPTMYNELITLEDPTALIMLQSQIQKTIIPNDSVEQAEITEGSSNNTQVMNSNHDTSLTSASVFKQIDAQIAKNINVVKSQPAEPSHSKPSANKISNVINENIIKELNVEILSSQSTEGEGFTGDLMQNQSPQEQTARIMIQGDIKYESVASETAKNITQTKTTGVTPGRIIEQISKQLEGMFNNSKLNMVLNPGSLGKLNLQIINSKEGILAQFTVTTTEARDILMKGLAGLKESLLAQGVSVDNVSVRLENTESEYESDYTEQEENSKGGYKHQGTKKHKEEGKDFEEMMFNLENEGNV